jgi:hypothetical protein
MSYSGQTRPKLPWLSAAKITTGQRVKSVPIEEVQVLRKWAFCSVLKADWRSRQGPRGPDGETAESRLYERDMPDILV